MSTRNRLTWNKAAQSAPAVPMEEGGYKHPASQPEPDAHKYENGDTSSWAEDVAQPPYPEGEEPALPHEGHDHPATKRASDTDIRVAAEQKAAKCIRIAQRLLGASASIEEVEDQAFPFMHLADAHLDETLARLSRNSDVTTKAASEDRIASVEKGLSDLTNLVRQIGVKVGCGDMMTEDMMLAEMMEDEAPPVMSEDMMLAEMLKEQAKYASAEDRMLAEMLAEAKKSKKAGEEEEEDEEPVASKKAGEEEEEDEEPVASKKAGEEEEEEDEEPVASKKAGEEEEEEEDGMDKDASLDIDFGDADDQMGLTASVDIQQNDSLLSKLYADASKTAGEEEEEEEVEEEPVASKKASAKLTPKPKTASKGAKSLGSVAANTRTAASEISDLANLWETSPDVSAVFSTKG